MSGPERGLINFSALEKELQASVRYEEKYQRENAAKLRAVSQGVPSYEHFRALVLTSHLKPLQRRDIQGAPRKQPWNPVATDNGTLHPASGSQHKTEDSATYRTEPGSDRD